MDNRWDKQECQPWAKVNEEDQHEWQGKHGKPGSKGCGWGWHGGKGPHFYDYDHSYGGKGYYYGPGSGWWSHGWCPEEPWHDESGCGSARDRLHHTHDTGVTMVPVENMEAPLKKQKKEHDVHHKMDGPVPPMPKLDPGELGPNDLADMGELRSDSDSELSPWDMDDAVVQEQLDRLWKADVEMRKRTASLTELEKQHLICQMKSDKDTLRHIRT